MGFRLNNENERGDGTSVCIKIQTEVPSPLSSNTLYGKI